jgi:hypothetical protein
MNFLIKQPAGLGDIFFLQKVAYALSLNAGTTITWPVIDEFLWIKEYLEAPYVNFISVNSDFPLKEEYHQQNPNLRQVGDTYIIPFQHADWLYPGISVMDAKYRLIDLDFSDWADFFVFNRNYKRENELSKELGIIDSEKYILVNRRFASPPDIQECENIPREFGGKRVIEMGIKPGFTLFDWCYIIEHANEIHIVDSSICFIIDKLQLNTEMIYLYTKPNHVGTSYHLFKTKYKALITT